MFQPAITVIHKIAIHELSTKQRSAASCTWKLDNLSNLPNSSPTPGQLFAKPDELRNSHFSPRVGKANDKSNSDCKLKIEIGLYVQIYTNIKLLTNTYSNH